MELVHDFFLFKSEDGDMLDRIYILKARGLLSAIMLPFNVGNRGFVHPVLKLHPLVFR